MLTDKLKAYLADNAIYDGPIDIEEAHEYTGEKKDRCLVIRDAGRYRQTGTRYIQFPAKILTFRAPTQAEAEADAWTVHQALDRVGKLQLTEDYLVAHIAAAGHPVPLGRDLKGRWVRQFQLNFKTPLNAQIH